MSEGLTEIGEIPRSMSSGNPITKTKHDKDRILCPAAEEIHPVTSLNKKDALCRIVGHAQPSKGSPCCGEYDRCMIWRTEVNRTRFKRVPLIGGSYTAPKTRSARVAEGTVGPSL